MTKIKALNETGIKAFHQLIDKRRAGKDSPINEILSNQSNLEATHFTGEIDPERIFKDRYELAVYLSSILKEFDDHTEDYGLENRDKYGKSAGLWSWFALVYFDQLVKPSNKGHEHYVFRPHKGLENYRHSIFTPFKTYKRWQKDSRVFFGSKIDTMGQIWESALSRDYLMSSSTAVRLMIYLYSDLENHGIAKSGASSQPSKAILKNGKPSGAGYGSVERFSTVFKRLKLTYHVQSLSPEDLLELMGSEFKQWVE